MRRRSKTALLVLAAITAALAAAGTASAKEPCWQTLINDWYDGRIDSVYPVACYRAALENQPEDVAQYSTLGDDISRALQAVIAAQGSGGSGGSSGGSGGSSGGSGTTASGGTSSTFHGGPKVLRGAIIAGLDGRDPGGGPLGGAISSLGGGSADSVPVPLIVLGALSIVLLALGAAGFLARRVQTKRQAVRASAKG